MKLGLLISNLIAILAVLATTHISNEVLSADVYNNIGMLFRGELVDIAKITKQISDVEIILKNPPRHDLQSNSIVERVVRDFKKQLMVPKIALERQIKPKINPKSPVLK